MRIAIIGAGNVGGGLGRAAVAAGHDVVITAAHPEKAQAVAAEIGAQSARQRSRRRAGRAGRRPGRSGRRGPRRRGRRRLLLPRAP